MKRRMKQYQRGATGLTATGMALGIGATAVGAMPNAPAGAGKALGNMAGFLPVTGSIMGGGMAMGMMSDLQKKHQRRRGR